MQPIRLFMGHFTFGFAPCGIGDSPQAKGDVAIPPTCGPFIYVPRFETVWDSREGRRDVANPPMYGPL